MEEKLAEAAEKRKVLEDCYRRIKEAASDNRTGQRYSNCHYRNHTAQLSDGKVRGQYFSVAN